MKITISLSATYRKGQEVLVKSGKDWVRGTVDLVGRTGNVRVLLGTGDHFSFPDTKEIRPVKKEPVKKEPVKKEPVKKEPVKKEPVKKEPVKKEPVTTRPKKSQTVPYKHVDYSHCVDKSGHWLPRPSLSAEGVMAYLSFFQDTENNVHLRKAAGHIRDVCFKRGKSAVSWMAFHVGARSLFINLDSADLRNIGLEDSYDPRKMSFKGSLKHELTHLLWDTAKHSPEAEEFERVVYEDAANSRFITPYIKKIHEGLLNGHLEIECFAEWGKFNEDLTARQKFPKQYSAYTNVLSKVSL